MTKYNISITSDIVCPWCYIGHTRLTRAIKSHQKSFPDDTFAISYKPFYLTGVPPQFEGEKDGNGKTAAAAFSLESKDRTEYYVKKFGSEARTKQIFNMLEGVATKEGLSFKFGGKTGHARNGHRLVYLAQQRGGEQAQNEVMLGLWRRYMEQEIDITELDVLVDLGVEAGLGSPDQVREFLVSGEGGEEVDRVATEEAMKGISGVPFYTIQDTWPVEGAQEPAAFEALFKRWKVIEARKEGNANATTGAVVNGDVKLVNGGGRC